MTIKDDLKEFPVYLYRNKLLVQVDPIENWGCGLQAHHYIKQQDWKRNRSWYEARGISQKIIFVPVVLHEQIHYTAVKNLNEADFESHYGYKRSDFLFKR